MNKVVSFTNLAAGLALILYGVGVSHAFGSGISWALAGSPTEKTIALLCAGMVFTVLGGYGLSRRTHRI